MIKKIALSIVIVLVIAGALVAIKAAQIKKLMAGQAAFKMPPETISSALVKEDKWQELLTAIGSIAAFQGVTITPDIPGTIREIKFESGATVRKGDLLVKLDTSTEEAQLRAMEAQVDLSRLTFERNKTLRSENMLSQSDLDSSDAALKQNIANADAIRATIEKKTIRAPFDGQLGIRQVNLGQYLDVGKPVASLQALSPVYADFSLPQQELSKLKVGMRVRVTTDSYPGKTFDGTLTAINPDLDQNTRSIGLQATIENAEQKLRPGMYAKMEVLLPEETKVLIVPATSVLSAPFGDSVYVIEPAKDAKDGLAVRQQFIQTVQSRGDLVAIRGLNAGDKVVTAGLFKLRNGMHVVENNTLTPKVETSPRPPDA